jgi:signal transduction histidine kinase
MNDDSVNPSSGDARDQVLGKLSHNLRTPLSVLHTTASMLLNPKYQFTPEQQREQLERLRRNIELLNRMAAQLSDIVNLRAGRSSNPEPLDANEALRKSVAALEATARDKGIVLTCEIDAGDAPVQADRQQMGHVFQHLVAGALDRGKNGERVTIRSQAQDRLFRIDIHESGAGTVDADGADPGLFISREIARAHGGDLRNAAPSGNGSTLTLTLPLAPMR